MKDQFENIFDMKKLSLVVLVLSSFGCQGDTCVSCVAQGASGKIVEHEIICDKSSSFIRGVRDGIVQRYKDQGDTVVVDCKFK